MEIKAALEAVRSLEGPLEVVSDSTYVVNCFRDRWWEGWLARGWLNKAKKPVANRDLWEPLIDAYRADPQRVRFTWVKGHSDDPMNDLVDRLAVEAAQKQVGRTGTGHPVDLGPADPAGREQRDDRVPPGHRLVVAGARPPELGGYDDNPVADRVRTPARRDPGGQTRDARRPRRAHRPRPRGRAARRGGRRRGRRPLRRRAAVSRPRLGVAGRQPRPLRGAARRRARPGVVADASPGVEAGCRCRARPTRRLAGSPRGRGGGRVRTARTHAPRQVRSLQDHLGDDVWVVTPAASP